MAFDIALRDNGAGTFDVSLAAAAGAITATLSATLADATLSSNATVTPAAGAVTATLSATLEAASLASAATVTRNITATLAATLANATLASNATVTRNITATLAATLDPATLASNATVASPGAVTATLAATLADATLTSAATVGSVAPPVQQFGGGGGSIHWRVAAKQRRKLEEAIRAALRAAEDVQEAAPFTDIEQAAPVEREIVQRDWTLPQPADFSTEAAHLEALTEAVDRLSVAIAMQNRARADEMARRRVEKAKALAAKVRKVLRLVDLADAA